jgi:hypothetical protein
VFLINKEAIADNNRFLYNSSIDFFVNPSKELHETAGLENQQKPVF